MPNCPHAHTEATTGVCEHLSIDPELAYGVQFTGVGCQHALLCEACLDAAQPALARVCRSCFTGSAEYPWILGVRGMPEVRARSSSLRFRHASPDVPAPPDAPVGVAALPGHGACSWLWLTPAGEILRIEPGASRLLMSLDFAIAPRTGLCTSRDGRFAAVTETRGRQGVVVDLHRGVVTMRLERGTYYNEHSDFSVAFADIGGRTVVIHATDWNRLDMSAPDTGELLTSRTIEKYREGDRRLPPHYLDYFHCGLTVSPDDRWIVDDGWHWHPMGYVRSWDLHRWRHENAFESEDGPSARSFRHVAYLWDVPRCFVGDRTLAAWGFGGDDEWMIPAADIYDVTSGKRVRWFAGPPRGQFFFDRNLVVAGPEGTTVWDVETGERLLDEPGFRPLAFHGGDRRYLSLRDGRIVVSELADTSGGPP